MKKIFNNSRLIAIAFFTVFTAMAPAVMANNSKDLPVELKYVGNINSQTIFELIVSGNTLNNDYTIIIRDQFGNPFYRENIKADNFTKKFLFDSDELGDDTLVFEIFNSKTNQSAKYKINRQSRFVEEVAVNAIK